MSRSPLAARTLRVAAAVLALATLSACGDSTAPDDLSGTYVASKFQVTPSGQPTMDVLAQGGSLSLTFGSNDTVTGTLSLPASVTGSTAMNVSMAGTVVRTGSTVKLQQAADSFVRDLTWTIANNTLEVVNQTAGSASFTITLTRQ